MNLEKVEVYDSEDIVNIKVVFSSIDLKAGLSEEDFLLEDLIDMNAENKEDENKEPKEEENNQNTENTEGQNTGNECENEECDTKSSNILDSIIYPLYIPSETYLSNSEEIDTDEGNLCRR